MNRRPFAVLVGAIVLCPCLQPLFAVAADEGPLRIVPQIGWADRGIASPDGSLLIAGLETYPSRSLRLVSKAGSLLWTIPLRQPADAAFSPDGKWLAACGAEEGLLLDLKNAKLKYFQALCGSLIAFTPDSRKLIVVRRGPSRAPKEAVESGLFVFDTGARQLARLPVAMEAPYSLEISADGKTAHIRGAHGNPAMHVPRMGQAEETINLDTGKTERDWGPVGRGWIGRGKDPRLVLMPDATRQLRSGGPRELYWNESSGLCALDVFTVWDIRGGRLLRDFRPHYPASVYGFSSRDTLLAMFWQDGRERLVQVNMRSGKQSPTAIAAPLAQAAPDGKSILVAPGPAVTANGQLELYRVPPDEPIYQQSGDLGAWSTAAWSRDGRFLACSAAQQGVPCVRLISTADGRYVEVPLADFVAAHAKQIDAPPRVWRLALDDSGGRLAVAMAGPDRGLVGVASRKTRAIETVLEGLPNLVNALLFVGRDRLLTGSSSGRVQLWDLAARRPLWTAETKEQVVQFGYVPGSPNVVCCNLYRSGVVLRLEDGKAVYKSPPLRGSDSDVTLPWTQPQLFGRGQWALEMDVESMQLRLVELATGRVALTYCGLSEGQWIAFTPAGDWDGSEKAQQWVQFCSGLRPVSPDEAEKRRSRAAIEAVLTRVFPDRKQRP